VHRDRTGQPGCPGEGNPAVCFCGPRKIGAMFGRKGFTLVEVLVVIAIIALVSAFTVPRVLSWRSSARLRGATANLKGDLQLAKARAVRENGMVVVLLHADGYEIFVDNGTGSGGVAGDWIRNGQEPLVRTRRLPAGVRIDLDASSFGAVGDKTRFNGRGRPLPGTIVLVNTRGEQNRIVLSRVGRLRVER